MALFDLSDVQQIDIPEPIAPVRPISSPVGQTIPFSTSSGITGQLDSAGNMWNTAGQYIGKMTSSGPVVSGTPLSMAGTAANPSTGSATQATSSPGLIKQVTQSIGALAKLEQWAANLVTRNTSPTTGVSLEDIVFVILGLMLIGAAVFTFKGTQTVIEKVSSTAAKAAEVAA